MRLIYLFVFLVVFIIGLLFSLWNLHSVQVNFYKEWGIELPLAVALTIELLAGVVIGFSANIVKTLKLKAECSKVKKKLVKTEKELRRVRTSSE